MIADPIDRESVEWLRDLRGPAPSREAAIGRLHALLMRVSHQVAARRRASLPPRSLDALDDLCAEAASDALMAVLAKLDTFRGTARFTTWACKFAIFETSSRLRRLAWRDRRIESDDAVWERLPDREAPALERLANEQLLDVLRRAVAEELTERQRFVFESVTLEDVPIDVLAERLGSSRGAIYKTLHDARAKLRRVLSDTGYRERVT